METINHLNNQQNFNEKEEQELIKFITDSFKQRESEFKGNDHMNQQLDYVLNSFQSSGFKNRKGEVIGRWEPYIKSIIDFSINKPINRSKLVQSKKKGEEMDYTHIIQYIQDRFITDYFEYESFAVLHGLRHIQMSDPQSAFITGVKMSVGPILKAEGQEVTFKIIDSIPNRNKYGPAQFEGGRKITYTINPSTIKEAYQDKWYLFYDQK